MAASYLILNKRLVLGYDSQQMDSA